jgi:hypothetical protein
MQSYDSAEGDVPGSTRGGAHRIPRREIRADTCREARRDARRDVLLAICLMLFRIEPEFA